MAKGCPSPEAWLCFLPALWARGKTALPQIRPPGELLPFACKALQHPASWHQAAHAPLARSGCSLRGSADAAAGTPLPPSLRSGSIEQPMQLGGGGSFTLSSAAAPSHGLCWGQTNSPPAPAGTVPPASRLRRGLPGMKKAGSQCLPEHPCLLRRGKNCVSRPSQGEEPVRGTRGAEGKGGGEEAPPAENQAPSTQGSRGSKPRLHPFLSGAGEDWEGKAQKSTEATEREEQAGSPSGPEPAQRAAAKGMRAAEAWQAGRRGPRLTGRQRVGGGETADPGS